MKIPSIPFLGTLAPTTRAILVVAVGAALIFLASKLFFSKAESTKPLHAPFPKEKVANNQVVTQLIRRAALSAQKAGEAKSPVQQIIFIREGMTFLDSARELDDSDDTLSLISKINVKKLDAYLTRAEEICVQKLRPTTSGETE